MDPDELLSLQGIQMTQQSDGTLYRSVAPTASTPPTATPDHAPAPKARKLMKSPQGRPQLRGMVWRQWIVSPVLEGLCAFPLSVATIFCGFIGKASRPAATQRRVAVRYGAKITASEKSGNARAWGQGWLTLLPAFIAFFGALMEIYLLYAGLCYPTRPGMSVYFDHPFTSDPGLEGSWGGPSLMGAWAIHTMSALGIQIVILPVIAGAQRIQDAVIRKMS